MKKTFLMCALALCMALSAAAQTTIPIVVEIQKQEIEAGPYARYAQKYLGVAAPLADKVLHEVKAANIMDFSEIAEEMVIPAYDIQYTHMNPENGFPRLTIDRTSMAIFSLEESARQAAEKIFSLRRTRLELISGEVGENVFGGGLRAALDEISRLEEDYLSLFLGRQKSTKIVKKIVVTPEKTKLSYQLFRISETAGVLPDDSTDGTAVMLQLSPTADLTLQPSGYASRPPKNAVPKMVPAEMRCVVEFGGVELASKVIEIQQFGRVTYVAR